MTTQRKPGAPAGNRNSAQRTGPRLTERLDLRLTAAQKANIMAAAEVAGLKYDDFIRQWASQLATNKEQ